MNRTNISFKSSTYFQDSGPGSLSENDRTVKSNEFNQLEFREEKVDVAKVKNISAASHKIGLWEYSMALNKVIWSDELYRLHELQLGSEVSLEKMISYCHGDDRHKFDHGMERLLNRQIAFDIELVVVTENRMHKSVQIGAKPILVDGKMERIVGYYLETGLRSGNSDHEISELSAKLDMTQKRLEVVNEEVAALSYSISHDLRAPMRAIAGFAEVLKEDYSDNLDDTGLETIETIDRNVKRANSIINGILSMSRVRRSEIKFDNVSLNQLAKSLVSEVIKSNNYDNVVFQIDESLPEVKGDRALLYQALSCILDNALKFSRTQKSPKIKIGSVPIQGLEKRIYVEDNGVGFDMNFVEKVFLPSERLHKQGEFDGAGMGMAIAKSIIDRHQGEIWAQSEPLKGCTFYIQFNE